MKDLNRRQFVAAAAAGCAFCVFRSGGEALAAAPVEVKTGPVKVGNVSEFASDGVFDKLAKAEQVGVVREQGKLSACSAIWTHKHGVLKGVDGQLRCPSHGSRFNPDGSVVKGPANRPLDHFAITKDSSGELTVDRSKKVDAGDPAAKVTV